MTVRVRMFAAVREAAGAEAVDVAPGLLPDVLAELVDRYGEPFRARLAVCTVLLDGSAVDQHADVAVPDGSEVVLLPPVSGGAAARAGLGR